MQIELQDGFGAGDKIVVRWIAAMRHTGPGLGIEATDGEIRLRGMGIARLMDDPADKMEALRVFLEQVMRGRWDDVRQPMEQELKATTVLALPLEELSAKIRTGGPIDDEADYTPPVWAGVLPLETSVKEPLPDLQRKSDQPIPPYKKSYSR